ncbi:MAG: D-alanine--D-alanine ligase [Hydrogenothermaceae bacterium]|nr:D-alanine--D-alanine ligase [Hydrogenothermaceae bacterium]
MSRLKIALVYGGTSREREISIKSGKAVEKALRKLGYEYMVFDPIDGKEFIDKIYQYNPDLVFLALHGKGGEDGTIQGVLEFLGIPYTGSDHVTSAITMDKVLTKIVLKHFGIKTPDWRVFHSQQEALACYPVLPVVVKAPSEGSSIGVYVVSNREEYVQAVNKAFRFDEKVLVEEYIKGRELTVSIIDGRIFDIVEIKVLEGFYDFNNKYVAGQTVYECPAAIYKDLYSEIQSIGLKTYRALNCRGPARVDIILSEEGVPYVLEINTIPGMTERSLLPKAVAQSGIDFNQLVEIIINNSLKGE